MSPHSPGPPDAPTRNPVLRAAFRVYKAVLSPILHAISPTQCRFLPTCSEYAYIAVARHGALRGASLALRRLARCHPWAKGGLDPVPDPLPERVPRTTALPVSRRPWPSRRAE